MTARSVSKVHRVWERQRFTGLGARATADMAGKRPLCALGPLMSALNFRFLFFKKKEEETSITPINPPQNSPLYIINKV